MTLAFAETDTNNMKPKSSQYRGVSWHKQKGKWLAYIKDRRLIMRQITIGIFSTELEAAQAYNEVAVQIHGDRAILNVLPDDPPPPEPDEIIATCAAIRQTWSEHDYRRRAPHQVGRDAEIHLMPSTLFVELV